ncbi:MAG: flagellar M-ring protein FliF [Zoogloeaceae bacterium]|jgi:flagellar M-ring protein FliF|nr:flagellar M-ring protein FliF [Zoogloeaceae bacterium]
MAANPEITAELAEAASGAASPSGNTNIFARLRESLDRLNSQQKLMLAVAVAAIVAILAGAYLWARQPDYRVLFANLSEKDGGAIIAALDQANVLYRYSDNGAAILVPAAQVHDVRLRLASQGLPRGGSIGFELMESQKFGASQFIEQVNYQRALQGELERTIESISAVQSARVHLAIPKPSVFVREEQKPTASVLLRLFPGRSLDAAQVAGISHLVASSVPQLPLSNVNIVDQNGNLISQIRDRLTEAGLDSNQLKYVRDVEKSVIERIQHILTPVLGEGNYRAQVAADLDFSHVEQTAETFGPNANRETAAIRSEQVSESANLNQPPPGGIPGALTNQPPVPATAPISQPPVTPPAGEAGGSAGGSRTANPRDPNRGQVDAAGVYAPLDPVSPPLATQKGVTTNYEVDKTTRYTRQSAGAVRRLTAAVVVNYRMARNRSGVEAPAPLPDEEIEKIRNLTREAMGYNEARGDSLSIANVSFTADARAESAGIPLWKDPETVARGLDILKYLVIAGILFAIYRALLRPVLLAMRAPKPREAAGEAGSEGRGGFRVEGGEGASEEINSFAAKVDQAKTLAQGDPKVVANMIKDWMGLN